MKKQTPISNYQSAKLFDKFLKNRYATKIEGIYSLLFPFIILYPHTMADFQEQLAKARLEKQEEYFKKNPSKRPQPKKEIPLPVNASRIKKDEEHRTELDKSLERAQWKRRKEYVATHAPVETQTHQHPHSPHEVLIASHPKAHRLGTTPTDEEMRQQLIHEISLQHAEKVIVACKKPEPPKTRMNEYVDCDSDDEENAHEHLPYSPHAHLPVVNEPIELPIDFEPTCFCMSVKHTKSVMLRICKHCFHENCLLPWLERNKTCPTCRCKVYLSPLEAMNRMQQTQT